MKELAIHVAPFTFKCKGMLKDIELGTYEIVKIPQREIASFISVQEDLRKVHLFGNDKIVRKIKEDCLTKYNVNNVLFVINE